MGPASSQCALPCGCISPEKDSPELTDLPTEVLGLILRCLSYRDLLPVRRTCRRLAEICGALLNSGFCSVEPVAIGIMDRLRAHAWTQLCLSRDELCCVRATYLLHVIRSQHDLLGALAWRYATGGPYRCFFAGNILDEFHRLLRLVNDHVSHDSISWKDMYEVEPLIVLTGQFLEKFQSYLEQVTVPGGHSWNSSEAVNRALSLVDMLDASFGTEIDRQVSLPTELDGRVHVRVHHVFKRCWLACVPVAVAPGPVEKRGVSTAEELCQLIDVLGTLVHWHNRNTLEHDLYWMENTICPGFNSKCSVHATRSGIAELPHPIKMVMHPSKEVEYWFRTQCRKLFFYGAFSRAAFEDRFESDPSAGRGVELNVTVDLRCLPPLAPRRVARDADIAADEDQPSGEFLFHIRVTCPAAGASRLPQHYSLVLYLPAEQTKTACVPTQHKHGV